MALHSLGGTAIAMGSILPRVDSIEPDEAPANAMRCDLCDRWHGQKAGFATVKVRRFALTASQKVGGRYRTRGAGSIRLCERCWTNGPAKRRYRARTTKAA
jgi:hypothetical protein